MYQRINRHRQRGGDWYVVVDLATVVNGRPAPRRRAIGPISWSRARDLAEAWEREHGTGTTTVRETPGAAPTVRIGR